MSPGHHISVRRKQPPGSCATATPLDIRGQQPPGPGTLLPRHKGGCRSGREEAGADPKGDDKGAGGGVDMGQGGNVGCVAIRVDVGVG